MKKTISILLAAAVFTMLIAGCGGNSSSAPASSDNAPSQQPAPSPEAGEKIEITVSTWDYSNLEYQKTQFEAFSDTYPDITVKVMESPSSEYDDKIQIMLSGGDTVDVVFTKGTPALSALIQKKQIMALDDYLSSASIDGEKYSGLIEQLSLDGIIYAMPYRKDNNLLFYNKDLFDRAGVPYPQDGMTMDEYRELAKKMTSGEGAEKIYGAHVHTWSSNVYQFSRRTGAYNPIENMVEDVKPYYDLIISMQNEDKSIMDYASLKAGSIHYSGVFYNQQVAMMQMGTWFINMLVENTASGAVTFKWGVCSLPDTEGTGNTIGVGGVTPVSINAKAKSPDQAWKFVQYVTSAEGALSLARSGILPGYTDETIVDTMCSLEGVPDNLGDYLSLADFTIEQPMSPKGREIYKIIDEEHDLIMTNSVSVESGIAELKKRIAESLAE